jgi:hypothetical protein
MVVVKTWMREEAWEEDGCMHVWYILPEAVEALQCLHLLDPFQDRMWFAPSLKRLSKTQDLLEQELAGPFDIKLVVNS